MIWKLWTVMCAAMLLLWPASAEEKRLALIIANADYPPEIGRLLNTHKDAATVGAALTQTGFNVTTVLDANEDEMEEAIYEFEEAINAEAADGDEVIAFFYASMHGAAAEVNGRTRNFLLPANEEINSVGQLVRTGIRMDELLQGLSLTSAKAVMVISDACRNNMATSFSKSTTKGFVPEPTGPGMLIAYATAPGSTTPDDGLFAETLAEEIVKPGRRGTIAIVDAIDRISLKRSFDGQPYFNPGGLPEWFCFAACEAPDSAPLPDPLTRSEIRDLQVMFNMLGDEVGVPGGRLSEEAGVAINRLSLKVPAVVALDASVGDEVHQRVLYEALLEAFEFNEISDYLTGFAAKFPDPEGYGEYELGPYTVERGDLCDSRLKFRESSGLIYQVEIDACMLWMNDVRDFDGDGFLDAFLQTNPGGAATPSSFRFVSYRGGGKFQVSEPFASAWEQDVIPSLFQSEWTVEIDSMASDGSKTVTERYAWQNGEAFLVEGGATQPVIADAELVYAEDDQQVLRFDLNEDGVEEVMACDPWDRWSVLICEITLGGSDVVLNDPYEVQGPRIGILSTKTDGWRDLVVGDTTIIRWNGTVYGDFVRPE